MQTCNGDGNGYISFVGNDSEYTEMFTFWQHLGNAGLFGGVYTGKAGSGFGDDALLGVNTPTSSLSGAGWSISDDMMPEHPTANDNKDQYGVERTKYTLAFGGQDTNFELNAFVVTPIEGLSIDRKIDDENGFTGKVRINMEDTMCVDNATVSNYDADSDIVGCSLLFREK